MRFIDLKSLKVVRDYVCKTQEVEIDLPNQREIPIKTIQELVYAALSDKYIKTELAVEYKIIFTTPKDFFDFDEENIDDGYDIFTSMVNITLAIFFNNFILDEGRKRERRLDVPESLKKYARVNFSLLKKAINTKTYSDKFHLTIEWGRYTYQLLDQTYEGMEDNTITTEIESVDVND